MNASQVCFAVSRLARSEEEVMGVPGLRRKKPSSVTGILGGGNEFSESAEKGLKVVLIVFNC